MSIQDESGWQAVEIKAQLAEAGVVATIPVPAPTAAQQLAFAVMRCAELQARVQRKDTSITTAIMWLSLGEMGRAQEELNRGLLDL